MSMERPQYPLRFFDTPSTDSFSSFPGDPFAHDSPLSPPLFDPTARPHTKISRVASTTSSTLSLVGKTSGRFAGDETASRHEAQSRYKRRWLLLTVFSLAMFIDIASRSAVMAFTTDITRDLNIDYATSTWVITSYALTFAAFLPLWGRVSDLFNAKMVFYGGAILAGVFSFLSSFLPDQYSFYVFRALAGVFAAATRPSAFRLINVVFPPHEIPKALTIFATAAAIANSSGLIMGGIFGIDRATNQMAGWRWFLRFVSVVSALLGVVAAIVCPDVQGERALALERANKEGRERESGSSKVAQMDILGGVLLFLAVLLLMLGLTLGAAHGWATAEFIAPFIISWPLFVAFFVWEYRLPRHTAAGGVALVPPGFWTLPNTTLLMVIGVQVFPIWATTQVPLLEWYQEVHGDSVILASVRLLPMGIAAIVAGAIVTKYSQHIRNGPFLSACSAIATISWILLIFSDGDLDHGAYWRWEFPAFIIGAAFSATVMAMVNVIVLQSVPAAMAGVAGALIQVSYQIGIVVALAIQAGLLTVRQGGIRNWGNVQVAFWFEFGWGLSSAVLLALFLRRPEDCDQAPESPSGSAGSRELKTAWAGEDLNRKIEIC